MSIFQRPHYTSEATDFIESLKATSPDVEAGQRLGRSLLWDKQIDHPLAKDMAKGQIAQKPYPYQTSPSQQ